MWKANVPRRSGDTKYRTQDGALSLRYGKKWSGNHARSRAEAKMNPVKLLGDQIVSRDPHRQVAESYIRIAIMKRRSATGTAETQPTK